jgi:hypothetical protein
MRKLNLQGVAACCLLACGDSSAPDPPDPGPVFRFRDPTFPAEVMRLEITIPAGIAQAESLLASGAARWAVGVPRRGNGGVNSPWHWHVDPASVSFTEVTIEACQTRIPAVDPALDDWIRVGQVCVWGRVEAQER